jgi:hypothetical protein
MAATLDAMSRLRKYPDAASSYHSSRNNDKNWLIHGMYASAQNTAQ